MGEQDLCHRGLVLNKKPFAKESDLEQEGSTPGGFHMRNLCGSVATEVSRICASRETASRFEKGRSKGDASPAQKVNGLNQEKGDGYTSTEYHKGLSMSNEPRRPKARIPVGRGERNSGFCIRYIHCLAEASTLESHPDLSGPRRPYCKKNGRSDII